MADAPNPHGVAGACQAIFVPLNAQCQIIAAVPSFVRTTFVDWTPTVVRNDPQDFTATNWGGDTCGPEQMGPPDERRADTAGNMCNVDWPLMSATTGNPVRTDAADNVIGYSRLTKRSASACNPAQVPRVAVALVRRALNGDGGCAAPTADTGATGCHVDFYPNTTNWTWDIPAVANSRSQIPFAHQSYSNPNIGAGPFNLIPATATPNVVAPDAFHDESFVDCSLIPAASEAPVPHPAVSDRSEPEEP